MAENIRVNDLVTYTNILKGTCSIVAEKDNISIRNAVINIEELDKRIEFLNQKGYDFDRETLINEYREFCNGGTEVSNLEYFKSICYWYFR